MKRIFLFLLPIIFLIACRASRTSKTHNGVTSLKYLGGYEVPYNFQFNGTTVGGLSGIDYDARNKLYYLICDDRSERNPARFYTAKIDIAPDGIRKVEWVNSTILLNAAGLPFPDSKKDPLHSPDPEALRYDARRNRMIWTSEGERLVKKDTVIQQPAIIMMDNKGRYIDTFPLPAQAHYQVIEKGIRRNSAFEGLAFAGNYSDMFISIEEPLYEDGPPAALQDRPAFARIIRYNLASREHVAQYAYHLEPVAHPAKPADAFVINGIPDILALSGRELLVVERSFSTGTPACTIRLYIAELQQATNVAGMPSLAGRHFTPVTKKLLLNMDDLGIYTDNIEGVTFGPILPNGHRSLLFVSDNNFAKEQKTQLLLFEVEESRR